MREAKSTKPHSARAKPLEIKKGSVRVRIYAGRKDFAKAGKDYAYAQYSVCYYNGSQRVRKRFSDLGKAKDFARNAAEKLARGHQEVLRLTPADAAIYVRAVDQIKHLNLPLNVALGEFVTARGLLPGGATLSEAARFYAQRNPAALERRSLQQVVDEMVQAKAAAKRSGVHLKDLEGRLNRFAAALPNYAVADVTGTMIQQFLDDLSLSERSKLNYFRQISALYRFAINRRYLPKDAHEALAAVEKPKLSEGEVEIFTAAEMKEILAAARSELVPWLAIGAFAGLRSAEIARLEWSEIDLQDRIIVVKAEKAKTGSRRVVPIADNLSSWLEPLMERKGKVNVFASWWNEVAQIAAEVNFQRQRSDRSADFSWHRNALRHSFCSYRLALTADAARVAYEAGNSPQMVHRYYKALVNERQAKEWFSITPEGRLESSSKQPDSRHEDKAKFGTKL